MNQTWRIRVWESEFHLFSLIQFSNVDSLDFSDATDKEPTQELPVVQTRDVGEYALKFALLTLFLSDYPKESFLGPQNFRLYHQSRCFFLRPKVQTLPASIISAFLVSGQRLVRFSPCTSGTMLKASWSANLLQSWLFMKPKRISQIMRRYRELRAISACLERKKWFNTKERLAITSLIKTYTQCNISHTTAKAKCTYTYRWQS
jgi:hypothetical protein